MEGVLLLGRVVSSVITMRKSAGGECVYLARKSMIWLVLFQYSTGNFSSIIFLSFSISLNSLKSLLYWNSCFSASGTSHTWSGAGREVSFLS